VAFVRRKRVGHQTYYYLVESYRPEGKQTPRQNTLMYLGEHPTVEDATADWGRRAEAERRRAQQGRNNARALRKEIQEGGAGDLDLVEWEEWFADSCDDRAYYWEAKLAELQERLRTSSLRRTLDYRRKRYT
jgi:hypothetical protein